MKKILGNIYTYIIFLFLYLPILILIFFSFNESRSNINFTGFSLKWYGILFNDADIMAALKNTIIIAILSSVISTIIGSLAAIAISNLKKFNKSMVMNVTYIPVLNPDIVMGLSLMLLFTAFYLKLGFITVLIAHITFSIPYVILSVLPKIRQMNPHLYEAALDLGAPPVKAFFKVVLPQLMPGIISGALLAFTLSIDDFIITYFVCGNSIDTLSTIIYTKTKQAMPPSINALCALMFVAVLIVLILANIKKDKKTEEVKR